MTDEEIVSLFSPMFDFVRNLAVPKTQRPQFLAHYTTLGVLEKIIKTEEVWLSNPLFMNDLQEMRFGMVEGLRIFNQLCAEPAFEKACGSKERVAAIQSAFYSYFQKFDVELALNVYVFCLSEHDPQHPNGRLSMWRAYGGDGDGVALVFKTDFITFNKDSPLLIAKVIYASEEHRTQWLRGIFAAALLILNQIPDDKLYIAAHQIFTVVLISSLISKHHGFSEENEWRIIYLPDRDVHKILTGGFHYVIGSHGVEPKLRLPIKPLEITPVETWTFDSILDRIILGPGVSSSLSANTIRHMLARYERKAGIQTKALAFHHSVAREKVEMLSIELREATRREANRLHSERWRRAHGIMPRRPAQKPWLAEGVSRSTWYRRGNRVRERAAVAATYATRRADIFARAETFVRELQSELAEVARAQAITAVIIGELAAGHAKGGL